MLRILADLVKQCEEKGGIPDIFTMSSEEGIQFLQELRRLYCELTHKKVVTETIVIYDNTGKRIPYDEVLTHKIMQEVVKDQHNTITAQNWLLTKWKTKEISIKFKDIYILLEMDGIHHARVTPIPSTVPQRTKMG